MKPFSLLIRITIYRRNTVVRVRRKGWFYGRIYRERTGNAVEKRAGYVVEKEAGMQPKQAQGTHGFFQKKEGKKSYGEARQAAQAVSGSGPEGMV